MNTHKARPLPTGQRNENPAGISFAKLVWEDFSTHERDFFSQGFWALFWHRFGNARMSIRPKILRAPFTLVYRLMRPMCQVICGIKLDYTVKVGRRLKLEHFGGMIIGARSIGDDVVIRQNTTLGIKSPRDLNAKPTIGSRVSIGAGAVIVGDIEVGDDVVIGANCVVYETIPPNTVVSPPRCLIRSRNSTPI